MDDIKDKDYRLQAVTTLSKDWTSPWSNNTHKAGTLVMAVEQVQYDAKHVLVFGLPNMTALFIDFAYTLWVESQHFLQKEFFLNSPSKNLPSGAIYPKEDVQYLIY